MKRVIYSMVLSGLMSLGLSSYAQQAPAKAAGPEKTIRIYYIGNSVTDTVQYGELAEMALKKGLKFEWGRHMIPGAPLAWIWEHPKDGFQEQPYGHYPQALSSFEWDVITLQPFDRHLKDDKEGDVVVAQKFMDLALKKNPDVQFYVYSRWPRMYSGGKAAQFDENAFDPMVPGSGGLDIDKLDDWQKIWANKYTGGWDNTNEGREYFELLTKELRKNNPNLKKPVLMIPVGDVMLELDKQMKAGKVKGYKTIWQFYKDGIHMGPNGAYVAACTFFAAIAKQSPEGLPYDLYGVKDPELAKIIQETAWKVVSACELAGGAKASQTK